MKKTIISLALIGVIIMNVFTACGGAGKTESKLPDNAPRCTLTVSCATILDNKDKLKKEKEELVPANGMLIGPEEVAFAEGESVYDLLKRITTGRKMHMEASYDATYDSYYVIGINNIYGGDCGDQSCWLFKVNGAFPELGCNSIKLAAGDKVEFLYSCQYGLDIGMVY